MKKDIHPNYTDTTITCACGESFVTRSAAGKDEVKVDVCNKCHPLFTGKQKLVDTSGRVEKFNKKFNRA